MKHIILSAAVINSVLGIHNLFFASVSWSIFNFVAAAACLYSYLDARD